MSAEDELQEEPGDTIFRGRRRSIKSLPGGFRSRKLTIERPTPNIQDKSPITPGSSKTWTPYTPGEHKTWEIAEKVQRDGGGDGMTSLPHPAQDLQTPGAVVSVWGAASTDLDKFKPCLSQKPMNFNGDFSCLPHSIGVMSHRGLKPDSPNQDDFFILARPESLLLGVLDGHGPDGHEVSHFGQENLPTYLVEHLRSQDQGVETGWSEAVSSSFGKLSTQAKQDIKGQVYSSGSTVSLLSLDRADGATEGPLRLRGAFLGDSSMVHAWRKPGGSWEWVQLTSNHKPDRPDEERRIIASGGRVQPALPPNAPARLMTPEWNLGVSRSFGDLHAVPYGLSSEPEVTKERVLEDTEEHILLVCSDGVWDVLPIGQAVNLVGRYRADEAQKSAEKLVTKAELRWQESEEVVDDITVIVVRPGFHPRSSSKQPPDSTEAAGPVGNPEKP